MQSELICSYLYRNAQCKLPESCERDWHAGLSLSSNRRETQRYLVLELFAQIHCSRLCLLCKQSGNYIETFILKQIPFPGLNFVFSLLHIVEQCVLLSHVLAPFCFWIVRLCVRVTSHSTVYQLILNRGWRDVKDL